LSKAVKARKDQPCWVYSALGVSQHYSEKSHSAAVHAEIQKNFQTSIALLNAEVKVDDEITSLPTLVDYAHYLLDNNKDLSTASDLLYRCMKIDEKDPWTLYGIARLKDLDDTMPFKDVQKAYKEAIKNVARRIEQNTEGPAAVFVRYANRLIDNSFMDYADFITKNNAQESVPIDKIKETMTSVFEKYMNQINSEEEKK